MAKAKSKRGRPAGRNMVELPKGFTAITQGGTAWDFREEPMITGVIKSFRDVESKKFFEGRGKDKKPKVQRVCTLKTEHGDKDVWESAALLPLFDLKPKQRVCIIFRGFKKIEGRDQPMKDFQVGVA